MASSDTSSSSFKRKMTSDVWSKNRFLAGDQHSAAQSTSFSTGTQEVGDDVHYKSYVHALSFPLYCPGLVLRKCFSATALDEEDECLH